MTLLTATLLNLQKPPMSLKQFMLRSEVLKLYRGFLRLGRLIEMPPEAQATTVSNCGGTSNARNLNPLQIEWTEWVRAEFRLRQSTVDDEATKMMLAHGKRQLQEIERTILLATNRNANTSVSSPIGTGTPPNNKNAVACKSKK